MVTQSHSSRHTHTHTGLTHKHTPEAFSLTHPNQNETLRLTCVSWSCAGRRRPPAPCTCWPAPLSPRRQVNPAGPVSSPGDGNRKRWNKKCFSVASSQSVWTKGGLQEVLIWDKLRTKLWCFLRLYDVQKPHRDVQKSWSMYHLEGKSSRLSKRS